MIGPDPPRGVDAAPRSRAGLSPDRRLADALDHMAATERLRSWHATAAAALELAAEFTADPVERAGRRYAAAADARLAGQRVRARALRAAGNLPIDALQNSARAVHLARTELFTGHPDDAVRVIDMAPAAKTDPALLATLGVAAILSGEAAPAAMAIAETRSPGSGPACRLPPANAVVRAVALLQTGAARDGARLLRRLGPAVDGVEYVILAAHGMSWIGEHRRGAELLAPVVDNLRAAGALGLLPFALFGLAHVEVRAGHTRTARSLAAEAVELADLTTDAFWQYRTRGVLAYVHAVRGEEAACRHVAAEASALRRGDRTYPPDTADALGVLETGIGRHDLAAVHLRTAATTGQHDFHRWAQLLEAQLRSGQSPVRVPAVVADRLDDGMELPLQAAIAWRVRGLAGGPGNRDADRCFEAALALLQTVDSPLDTGRTHLAFGERLRRAGHRIRAREHLRRADEIFTRVDARLLAGRARDELAAAGQPAISRPLATGGVESLTPQEFQAARAVATGATNREVAAQLFLSTKTVEFHLSNVYRKLGVRTRTELAHRYPALTAVSATG